MPERFNMNTNAVTRSLKNMAIKLSFDLMNPVELKIPIEKSIQLISVVYLPH